MSQPLDRTCLLKELGDVDREGGEFWVENPFEIAASGENLSAYERNRVFMNVDGESFINASYASGADIDADSRSVITADFNNNGAMDVLVGSVGGGPLRLFMNQMPQKNRIRIQLESLKSNRAAIGTRLIARINERQVVRDVFPANGFMGQGPPIVDLGLGDADQAELQIRWPDGSTENRSVRAGSEVLKLTQE